MADGEAPVGREIEQPGPLDARPTLIVGWILFATIAVFELVTILRSNHAALVRRLPDDSFYYLQVANRLGRGDGFTFDGVHETNGFHPLWQALLVPVAWLDGDTAVKAALVLGLAMVVVAIVLVVRVVALVTGPGAALLGGIVALQFGTRAWVNGMEGPAVILAFALLLTTLVIWAGRPTAGNAFVVGFISAMLVLSRFDTAAVVAIVPIAMGVRARSWRACVEWLGGIALIGVPVLAWWLWRFGHVLSTSATVKNATLADAFEEHYGGRWTARARSLYGRVGSNYTRLVRPDRVLDRINSPAPNAVWAAFKFGLLGLWLFGIYMSAVEYVRARSARKRALSPAAWALIVVSCLVGLKALFDIVAAPLWATTWYSAPQRLAGGLVLGVGIGLGVRAILARRPIWTPVLLGVLVFAAIPFNAGDWTEAGNVARNDNGWQTQIDLAADWVLAEGPEGRYGARDAGLLAYRLDGTFDVVNLDGLVNDYEFAELVADGATMQERIAATDVDYLVQRLHDDEFDDLACGRVLWTSPQAVPYGDAVSAVSEAPVRVLDVRAC